MKSIKFASNNDNYKRFFTCDRCHFPTMQNNPRNVKGIKCQNCGYNLREISDIEYQAAMFNYVKNNQKNNNINIKKNKNEDMKVNYQIMNRNNDINNFNMNLNQNDIFTKKKRINIDNNLSDDELSENNINNNNFNQIDNLENMNKINYINNNNINNNIQRNFINNPNIINNANLIKEANINNNNINQKFPTNRHINYINNNPAYPPDNNINNNINNMNNINRYNIPNNNTNINIQPISNNIFNQGYNPNLTNNNINNYNQNNFPQNNPNIFLNRQNTTPITQAQINQHVIPRINNIESNNNPYRKSNSSNIRISDFWQRIDSHKERKNNNIPSSNRNMNFPELPNSNPFNNRNRDPMNEILDDFFGNFFNDTPSSHIHIQSSSNDSHEPQVFFHSFFSPFGVGEGLFSQNYTSNFNRNFFGDIASLIELAHRGKKQAHPPASQEALSKLKRFPLQERFCQKKEGKLELPNCCICQSEIELGKETVLLPCGHMYHWDCCSQWLNTNNTCPICRFEIK